MIIELSMMDIYNTLDIHGWVEFDNGARVERRGESQCYYLKHRGRKEVFSLAKHAIEAAMEEGE